MDTVRTPGWWPLLPWLALGSPAWIDLSRMIEQQSPQPRKTSGPIRLPAVGKKVRLLLFAVAAVTYSLAAWSVQPGFYDGFAPSSPYRWVSPPPQFAAGNQPPLS